MNKRLQQLADSVCDWEGLDSEGRQLFREAAREHAKRHGARAALRFVGKRLVEFHMRNAQC